MKHILSVILLTFSLSAVAAEKDLALFEKCSGWIDSMDSYQSDIDALGSSTDSLSRQFDAEQDTMDSAEMWLSIQEAAGDIDGANRSVRNYNSALARQKTLQRKHNRKNTQRNNAIDTHEGFVEKYNEYCLGNWETSVIDAGCKSYDDNTESMCDNFNQ